MVHESGRSLGTIPYRMTYDGTSVNLASPAALRRPFTGLGTRREEIVLQVDPQTNQFAGTYRDVLTLNYIAF